jgi:hypothetical protein
MTKHTTPSSPPQFVYQGPSVEDLANIPDALKARPQWILWRGIWRPNPPRPGQKATKIPINPRALTPARVDDPRSWATYETTVAALDVALEEWKLAQGQPWLGGGVDFVFSETDDYFGLDLDTCIDPATGTVAAWAQAIVAQLSTYTELSQGRAGLHLIGEGTLPPGRRKKGQLELYSEGRFFALTGWRLDQYPATIEPRQAALNALWCQCFGQPVGAPVWCVDGAGVITNPAPWVIQRIDAAPNGEPYAHFLEMPGGWPLVRCELVTQPPAASATLALADEEIVQRIKEAANADTVIRLALGNWDQDYPSQSEADLALCVHFAFWTRDPAQLDRLFRTSGLLRDKWDEKRGAQTYGQRTIAEALARQTEYYAKPPVLLVPSVGSPSGPSYVWGSAHEAAPALWETRFVPTMPWPVLADEALYGLAGRFVRTVKPETEADPVGLLLQFLIMTGNLIGRTPHAIVEADWHYLNLFGCLVGDTAKSRKGTSYGHERRFLQEVDTVWAKDRIMGGMSSGEGLIWPVRDPDEKNDAGVDDKRLMIFEPEFAPVLRVLAREGNTLSAVVRHAWDDGNLQTLVSGRRVAPVSATNAFISIVAHITQDELRRNLTETETSNGFANRFLWCCVRRAQFLPEGGTYPDTALRPLVQELKTVVTFARKAGTIRRDADARAHWAKVYEKLSEGRPGLLGHVTARAEAQVLRLSCLYALLDQSPWSRSPISMQDWPSGNIVQTLRRTSLAMPSAIVRRTAFSRCSAVWPRRA